MKTGIYKSLALAALIAVGFSLSFARSEVKAATNDTVKHNDVPVENRFVVGPAKNEAEVPAGDTKEVLIDIENRTGRTETYVISFEDFVGVSDSSQTVKLLGSEKSKTSLRDYLYTPQTFITLNQGDRVRIPITISIPGNETPGGKFASVVVSAQVEFLQNKTGENGTGASVVGRVATLLFVTVPGNITHDGVTESFRIARGESVFFLSPISFQIAYRNSGTTYENPYGGITIRNIFGKTVGKISIDPWYVLPLTLRTREITFTPKNLFGWYTATLELNRGYGDSVDTKVVSFTVFNPVTLVLLLLVVVSLTVYIRRRAVKNI
jgi:hypothetical protein